MKEKLARYLPLHLLRSRLIKNPIAKYRRLLAFILLVCWGWAASLVLWDVGILPVIAQVSQEQADITLEQQGKQSYETGDFIAAAIAWEKSAQIYQTQGDKLSQARVLSNLSLAYQQLGKWEQANVAITDSLNILQTNTTQKKSIAYQQILAQVLNNQGSLQLAQGKAELAFSSWEEAAKAYNQAKDELGTLRSQINQASALKTLGFYRRALNVLTKIYPVLKTQPDSHLKATGLLSFGDILRKIGDLKQSQQVLEESLAIAQKLDDKQDIAATLLSLGNTAQILQDSQAALSFYQQAEAIGSNNIQIQAQLAQLDLLLDNQQWQAAQELISPIQSRLSNLPLSRNSVYTQLNLANSLTRLKQNISTDSPSWKAIAQIIATALQQAKNLEDSRSEAYALGLLGKIYEQTQQWAIASDLTQQALLIAQRINAPEISYRWQWQLGKIFTAQQERQKAIAAYSEAVNILKSLEEDLVAVSQDVQFSFQENIEPVYRELISLLLQPNNNTTQEDLSQALTLTESLQLVELDNFFREVCLNAQPVKIEAIDPKAAVIYPIILRDRLEIILSLPDSPLRHYTIPVSPTELEKTIERMRQTIVIRSKRDFFSPSQQLYNWLIGSFAQELTNSQVQTLVFVLDGSLRNIPMAALHDKKEYLVEKYNIALTPGLQLLNPRPLQQMELKVLAAGITQSQQNFSALDYVTQEIDAIKSLVPSVVLLDEKFTSATLQEQINLSTFPIVHIATHGQFSSNLDETFILAWNSRINIKELNQILQTKSSQTEAIELLVLSSCQTASGDKRAALGLAGMAVKAGARSTAATLWSVNDSASAEFMNQFYQELVKNQLPKAQSLRQAQLNLLKEPLYQHPYYWAAYVLLGNWL